MLFVQMMHINTVCLDSLGLTSAGETGAGGMNSVRYSSDVVTMRSSLGSATVTVPRRWNNGHRDSTSGALPTLLVQGITLNGATNGRR